MQYNDAMKFHRVLETRLQEDLYRPGGVLLMGPRQVGKTTLIADLLKGSPYWHLKLQEYALFQNHLKDSGLFRRQALARLEGATPKNPLRLFVDEVQKLPALLEDCQWLIDEHREKIRILITGSSARKLKKQGGNLLPGRVRLRTLTPLLWEEIGGTNHRDELIHLSLKEPLWAKSVSSDGPKWPVPWKETLIHGALPGVLAADSKDRADLLTSYALTYLKEEIQAEALIRSLEGFSRFLELAASESGRGTNYQKLSSDVGLPLNTIKNYYSILVDTLVAIPLEPYIRNARKRLVKTPRVYFFDIGVRNAAAGLPISLDLLKSDPGGLFEHWVVLEIMRRVQYAASHYRCYFWRTNAGAEVDLILDTKDELIPMEIKWTSKTTGLSLKGLQSFMSDYRVKRGYVIGNFPSPEVLEKNIVALPWWWI